MPVTLDEGLFFFSSRRRHTRCSRDWSSDVCSSDLATAVTSQVDFNNVEFHRKHLLPFYDKHLKGEKTSYDQRPSVEYAVKNTGVTRSFDSWPPVGTRKARFYLGKGPTGIVTSLNDGSLQSAPPSADGGSTTYADRKSVV